MPRDQASEGHDDITLQTGADRPPKGSAPRQIGPFHLIELLGRGGQGEVYRAEDSRLGRTVALKILSHRFELLDASTREIMRARFEREAEVAARLDHPGICRVFEFGQSNDLPWIAMQLVEGTPLDQLIKARRITEGQDPKSGPVSLLGAAGDTPTRGPREARSQSRPSQATQTSGTAKSEVSQIAKLFELAARALHVAHESGLVHRDIKPANIMVTPERRPVLMDFGIAHDRNAIGPTLTRTGEIMGTPAYMAPEQIVGNHQAIDRRTDIYALGATLFECLSLRRPFEAPTHELLFKRVTTEDPPDLRKLNPLVSRDLATIVECALEKNPERRYRSAEEFASDLERARTLSPIKARRAGTLLKLTKWVQRNPVFTGMTAIIFLLMASTAAVFFFKSIELGDLNQDLESTNLELSVKTEEAQQNEKRAQNEATAKTAALAENTRVLAEYQRMADTRRILNARAEARSLWPVSPGLVPQILKWQQFYQPLLGRLQGHKDALAALATKASRNADGSLNFGQDADLHFRYETLDKLTKDLGEIVRPGTGLAADLAKRLDLAKRIEAETIFNVAEAWRSAMKRVAEHPLYSKVKLSPQLGLIPLGPDAESGLEEFLHWQTHSGSLPTRGDDGRVHVNDDTGLILVLIPGGTFNMGAQSQSPEGANYDPKAALGESPVLSVALDAYFLSKYEMTQGQWNRSGRVLDAQFEVGYTIKGGKADVNLSHPAELVTWEECTTVMAELNLELPTEAQWEYAARGNADHYYPGTSDFAELGKYGNLTGIEASLYFPRNDPAHRDPFIIHAPVGQLLPNPFGLFDLAGNVTEWCRECTIRYQNSLARPGDGYRESSATGHIARGGSFNVLPQDSRTTQRTLYAVANRSGDTGLRPVRKVEHK